MKKVRLTVLSDEMCKKFGVVKEKEDEKKEKARVLVVNTRKELCGAFLHKINTTFVNYTTEIPKQNTIEE